MSIDGTPQADTLDDTAGNDVINGFGGNDLIDVTNGLDEADGGDGDDILRIQWSAETVALTSGAPGAGFDFRLIGGAGRRIDFRGFERVEIEAGSGNDNFTMGATNDRITDGPRNITGNLATGNDTLGGGGGDDLIDVTTGNDSADGGEGYDRVQINWYGSSTAVTSAAALPGFQYRYVSGAGRSIDLVGIEDIFISGGTGNDVLVTYDGDDLLSDGTGTFDNDSMSAGAGDDQLDTEAGHDVMDGGDGIDTGSLTWTDSTAAIVSVAAPGGFDMRFESGPNRSANFVGIENVVIFAGTGNDNVTTGAGNDIYLDALAANSGNDYFGGGGGDDFQFMRTGNDRSDGGDGYDGVQIEWDDATTAVTTTAPTAGYEYRFQVNAGRSAEVRNVEEINFFSGSGADTLTFGNTRDFVFAGGGNDVVDGGGEVDYLSGDDGNDQIGGGGGDDDLIGGGGNDTLRGGDDDDYLEGGSGTDALFGDAGNDAGRLSDDSDSFTGGAGVDTAIVAGIFASFTARVSADTEVLLLVSSTATRFGGGGLRDYNIIIPNGAAGPASILTVQATGLVAGEDLTFNGAAQTNGAFRIFAGRGVDQLTGGSLNDGFFFDADAASSLTGADRMNGGAGTDTVALRGNYVGSTALVLQDTSLTAIEVITLLSGHTNEFGGFIDANGFDYDVTLANGNVAAGQSLDIVAGNLRANESARIDARAELDGAVRIFSGAGDDILFGSAGADLIWGGLGADALDGSGGSDRYVYRTATESTAASRDTIAFGAGDKIDLATIDANSAAAGDSFAFIGSAAFSNTAGELRAYDGGGGQWIVEGDVDGDGTADLVIAVTSATTLVASDFIL